MWAEAKSGNGRQSPAGRTSKGGVGLEVHMQDGTPGQPSEPHPGSGLRPHASAHQPNTHRQELPGAHITSATPDDPFSRGHRPPVHQSLDAMVLQSGSYDEEQGGPSGQSSKGRGEKHPDPPSHCQHKLEKAAGESESQDKSKGFT